MTIGTLRTQGTELFFVDSLSSSVAAVIKLACPTGITGLGGAADQLEDTCLDNIDDKTYKRGLGNPGQVSVPFNFIPSNSSHQVLFDLKESGDVIQWLIGLSDGTADPTLDSNDNIVPPPAPQRTSLGFDAYIADVNIDIATNEIVRGTLTLQRSGPVRTYWNGPIPT
ncbi:phage tail tube protein [Lysobacter antibioticus]|uniref:phage tail tube protein n=1 Tax=Lysobacter antibioticus TaxID=84531 RepID=UPI00034B3370|nr:phage tail tube protein [Lysobacter antibioticus]